MKYAYPFTDENGETLIFEIGIDNTDKINAIEALKESEEKYKNLVENINDAVFFVDNDGIITYVSPIIYNITGYIPDELTGKSFNDFIYTEDLPVLLEKFQEALEGAAVPHEFRIIHKNGSLLYVRTTSKRVIKNNKVIGINGILTDISEKKNMEVSIRLSEEKYRLLVENLNEGIWQIDENGNTVFVNYKMAEMLGYSVNEIIGRPTFDFMDENSKKLYFERDEKRKQGKASQIEYLFIKKDGSMLYTLLEPASIFDDNGNYKGSIAGVIDISETKAYQEKIKRQVLEQEILLKELYHRVKNNMQVLASIIEMKILKEENINVVKSLMDLQSKIRSMSIVHEKLYASNSFIFISFRDLIESIISEINRIYVKFYGKVNINYSIEDVQIDLYYAIPCALIINELISNSYKHAFHDIESPRIDILLKNYNDLIEINIKDNGCGIGKEIDLDKTDTLGLKIVSVLIKQINGKIESENENGTIFKITFENKKK